MLTISAIIEITIVRLTITATWVSVISTLIIQEWKLYWYNTSMIKTRFAPSPTGMMHIGGVRTALYEYLVAKKDNGTFSLRIEDTDRNRFVPGATEDIIESLKWLGLDFVELIIQSERKN